MEIADELENYFKEQNVQITLFPEDIIHKFITLREFYDFIKIEYEFWNSCSEGQTSNIRARFTEINNCLDNSIGGFSVNNYPQQNIEKAINLANMIGFPNIYSISVYGQLIKARYVESSLQANGVIDFIQGNSFSNINSVQYFKGILFAFNWKDSEIACKRFEETQDSTFIQLKNRYSGSMSVLHSEYLNKNNEIKEMYNTFSDGIKAWKVEIENNTFDFLEDKKTKLMELEKTYKENLKLKAPAEYWDTLREEYEVKGSMWRNWSIVTAIILIIFLSIILYITPDSLNINLNKFKFEDLRATLILTIIISIGVYMLRIFVKLSLSAYHLSRDAKERNQLTYVYLSLLNEGTVSESERSIVFQSLFSRADTGLLKGDSSPSIPDGLIHQITKLMGK
ncbi:MAG TPA: DUF6161 domain-containing protein [Clostridium sp.]|uniref:DUF6161 domain-containing protein n=1 Tax=Clostridium sp. TaxID=1506 RepID=UPI002F93650B